MDRNRYLQTYNGIYQELCKWEVRSNINENSLASLIFLVFLKYINDNGHDPGINYAYELFQTSRTGDLNAAQFQDVLRHCIRNWELHLPGGGKKMLSRFAEQFELKNIHLTIQYLLSVLDELEFSEDEVGNEPYDILVEFITALARKDLRIEYGMFTDRRLSCLMSLLADVKDGGSFYDFASGFGISAIECVRKNKGVKIYLQDINITCSAISLMMSTLAGVREINIKCGDSFLEPEMPEDTNDGYDYIVCDPPLGIKMTKEEMYYYDLEYKLAYPGTGSSGDMIPLRLMRRLLSSQGTGIMVIPLGLLSRMNSDKLIRKAMVEDNVIDAIIELPTGIIPGTAIRTALLLMKQRQGSRQDVYFLDLNREEGKKYLEKLPRTGYTLKEETLEELANIIKNHIIIPELSESVQPEEIADNDFNLSTSQYIKIRMDLFQIDDPSKLAGRNRELMHMYDKENENFYNIYYKLRRDNFY